VREFLKRFSNALLRPLDLEIRRHERPRIDPAIHLELIEETMGCYRALGLLRAPPDERRARLMAELTGTRAGEAIHIVEYLHRSMDAPGDVCEFGVASGATSALLANEIRETSRDLWLFDSFEGLPKPSAEDVLLDDILNLGSMAAYEGRMAFPVKEVRARLARIGFAEERVRIVPGFIEDTISGPGLPDRVSFAYVDFDFYAPIRIALGYLHAHMQAGAHVVIDDYGFFSEGAKTAVDEFVAENPGVYEVIMPHAFAGHFVVLRRTV
jgi:O-methyltransferase